MRCRLSRPRRSLNLEPDAGDVDISFEPPGTTGYDDLSAHAEVFDIDGVEAPTASLADVIRSKKAANRPKDLASLPVLEEIARRGATTDS